MAGTGFYIRAVEHPAIGTDVLLGWVKVKNGQIRERFNEIGQGRITVPAEWAKANLDTILSTDDTVVADQNDALLQLWFDDNDTAVPDFEFFASEADEPPDAEQGAADVKLWGGDLNVVLKDIYVLAKDHPTLLDPDWVYGSVVSTGTFRNGDFEGDTDGFAGNGGFEDGVPTPWRSGSTTASHKAPQFGPDISTLNVLSGTYSMFINWSGATNQAVSAPLNTLEDGRYQVTGNMIQTHTDADRYLLGIKVGSGYTDYSTNGFAFNGYVWVELDNASEGTGATDQTWQSFALDVDVGSIEESELVILAPDPITGRDTWWDDFTISGPGGSLDGWVPTTIGAATVTTFELATDQVDTGTYSLKFAGTSIVDNDFGARQVIEGVTPGITYTATARVRHDGLSASDITLVFKRPNGGWTAQKIQSVSPNTWTTITLTATFDQPTMWLTVRWGESPGASPNIWLDNVTISSGTPGDSAGGIVLDLLTDIQARGTATWLATDFTASVDSAGNAWNDAALTITLTRGQSLYQVLRNKLGRFGYEWAVENVGGTYTLRIWNPLGRGTDQSSTVAFIDGVGYKVGRRKRIAPKKTVVYVEGEDGGIASASDANNITNFGRREDYIYDRIGDPTSSLADRAQAEIDAYSLEVSGLKVNVPRTAPFVPYAGDFSLADTIASDLTPVPRQDFRVMQITTNLGEGATTGHVVHLNSIVFEEAEAVEEHMLRLLAKFEELANPPAAAIASGPADIGFIGPIEPTYLVAAADARPEIRDVSDFRCDNNNDDQEVISALELCEDLGRGTVVLSEGQFRYSNAVTIRIPSNCAVEGQGSNGETLWITDAATTLTWQFERGATLRKMTFTDDEIGG